MKNKKKDICIPHGLLKYIKLFMKMYLMRIGIENLFYILVGEPFNSIIVCNLLFL